MEEEGSLGLFCGPQDEDGRGKECGSSIQEIITIRLGQSDGPKNQSNKQHEESMESGGGAACPGVKCSLFEQRHSPSCSVLSGSEAFYICPFLHSENSRAGVSVRLL